MSEPTETLERVYKCQFCGKSFARKPWFTRHTCAKKRKFEQTNDVITQHAFRLFTYWMGIQNLTRRGKAHDFDKFLASPLKGAFLNLVMYSRENGIHSPYSYVDWLVQNRVPERNWCNPEPSWLDQFKVHTNQQDDPEDQALNTVREIEKWILDDPEKRTPQDFFDKLSPGVLLTLVRQRRIRPWVLFTYEPVMSKWLDDDNYDAEIFYRIDDIVNCDHWATKIEQNPDGAALVKAVMDQLWQYQT